MPNFLFSTDEESTGKVNIDELYDKSHQRDLKQLSIFNKILIKYIGYISKNI